MRSGVRRSEGLVQARVEPRAGWSLLWLPLLLIVFDDSASPSSAMIRLALVLLLGILIWGMGRGPAGPWAERGFAALLLMAWFAVCGTSFRLHGVPDEMPARLAVAAGLLMGPVFLLWAWRRRASMVPVVDSSGGLAESGAALVLLRSLLLAALALLALDQLLGLRRVDLVVIGTSLALYATFRVQGRHRELGVLG